MDLVTIIKKIQHKKAERRRTGNQAICLICKKQTTLLTYSQAMNFYEITADIMRNAGEGAVHFVHNSRGEVLICQESLRAVAEDFQKTIPLRIEFLQRLKNIQSNV